MSRRKAGIVCALLSPGPAAYKFSFAHARRLAYLRCAQIAVASEKYRSVRKSWPAGQQELVNQGLLPAMLIDPFDGQPLRMNKTVDGLAIYSVFDYKTGSVSIRPANEIVAQPDIGFRLWNVNARRSAPLPPFEKNPDN